MAVFLGSESQIASGAEIEIGCPACPGRQKAGLKERRDRFYVLFVPVLTVRNTYARCGGCGRTYMARVAGEKLVAMPPEELDAALVPMGSMLLARWLVLLALLVCWLPVIGLLVGLWVWRRNRRLTAGLAATSWLAMAVGAVFTAIFVVIAVQYYAELPAG